MAAEKAPGARGSTLGLTVNCLTLPLSESQPSGLWQFAGASVRCSSPVPPISKNRDSRLGRLHRSTRSGETGFEPASGLTHTGIAASHYHGLGCPNSRAARPLNQPISGFLWFLCCSPAVFPVRHASPALEGRNLTISSTLITVLDPLPFICPSCLFPGCCRRVASRSDSTCAAGICCLNSPLLSRVQCPALRPAMVVAPLEP